MTRNPHVCDKDDDYIIDVILSVGEKVSDITLYPYQREFARRIVESVVKQDAETITALFSRQCVTGETRVSTPSGSIPISRIKKGDKVYSYMNGALTVDTVSDVLEAVKKVRRIKLSDHSVINATPETRFYNENTQSWSGLQGRNTSLFKKKYLTVNNCELMDDGTPTNTPVQTLHDPKKTAEQALLLVFGRDDPHMYISSMLGENTSGYFSTDYALDMYRDNLGLEMNETGRSGVHSTIVIDTPELDLQYIHTYRKEILTHILSDSTYTKDTNKLAFHTRSTGKYRHTLISLLNAMGLAIRVYDNVISFTSLSSLLFALPALKDHYEYSSIHSDVFRAPRMDSVYKMLTEDALAAVDKDSGFRRTYGKSVDKRSHTCSMGGFARAFIERNGFEAWNHVAPDWMYVRVTNASRLSMEQTFDMETENTGNFFANEMLVHNCGKSESLKIATLGLILWMPALAKTYPQDKRFQDYAGGFWVGLFAPNLKTQVKNIYNRIRNALKTKHGKSFIAGLEVDFVINQAFEFVLDNGSRVYGGAASINANIESQTFHLVIGDEAQDIDSFKWKKSIVPMTTFTAGSKVMVGTANTVKSNFYDQINKNIDRFVAEGKKNHFQVDYTIPSSVNENYRKSVKQAIIELGLDSDEFQMAYNNKFIFSRGMAIDPELLNFNSNEHPRGVIFDHEYVQRYKGDKKVVVGVDIGKKHDPTVCTAVEVDTDNPVEMEHFRTFKKKEIGKMEILGDDIEAQVPQILDFIERMQATTIVVDATGGGDHFFDMLQKRAPKLNWIPFVFSQKSRSELWKAFLSDMSTGRVKLAGGTKTQETIEYYKTLKELGMLEKHYNGQYLACAAPDTRNAHDDYAVSLALACWACKDYFVGELVVTRGFFKERRRRTRNRRHNKRFR